MKKILILITATAMLFGISNATFSDVSDTHWGYEAISKMEQLGILSGYPDGTFKPSQNINLGEFASIFTKVFSIKENIKDNYFEDVSSAHWAKSKIEAVRTYIDPVYDPIAEVLDVDAFSYMPGVSADIKMPREAVIFALYRIYGFDEEIYIPGEEKELFADYEEILDPKSVTIIFKKGIISGEVVNGKTYIRPQRYITRAEFSSIIRKLLGYNEKIKNDEGFNILENVITDAMADVKKYNLDTVKDKIYDPCRTLQQETFALNGNINKDMKSAIDIIVNNFDYEVIEHGFTSYNHAYLKLKINTKDFSKQIEKAYSEFYTNLDIPSLNTLLTNDIVPDILKNYKSLDKIEKEITINFVKYDDEWKISL